MIPARFGWNYQSNSGEENFYTSSMYLLLFCNCLPFFIWKKNESLYPKMLCAKFGLNWPHVSREEKLRFPSMYFCSFIIICPWESVWPYIWINLNPYHQMKLCAKFEISTVALKKKIFKISSMHFYFSVLVRFRKGWGLHLNKIKSDLLHPRMPCAKFGWNWTCVLVEEIF